MGLFGRRDRGVSHESIATTGEATIQGNVTVLTYLAYSFLSKHTKSFRIMHVNSSTLILLFFLGTCHAIPVTPDTNAPLDLLTLSTLGTNPPKEFDTTFIFQGTTLRSTSCLLSVLAAQKRLALEDFEGKVLDQEIYGLSGSDVAIAIMPSTSDETLERRFAMWAIQEGIVTMNAQNRYESLEVSIWWKKRRTGWVSFYSDPKSTATMFDRGARSHNATIDNRQGSAPSGVVNITNSLSAVDESRVKVGFKPFGDILDIYDVFILIISSLIALAAQVKTERVEKWTFALDTVEPVVGIEQVASPASTPPFLQYQWIIVALARAPPYMLREGRFVSVWMKVFVDGVYLGWGAIDRILAVDEFLQPVSRFNQTLS